MPAEKRSSQAARETKHGVPVARIIAPDVSVGNSRGFMRGSILAQQDIVSPDHETWGEFGK